MEARSGIEQGAIERVVETAIGPTAEHGGWPGFGGCPMFGLSQTWGSSVPFFTAPSRHVVDLDEGRSSSGIRGIAAPEPIPRGDGWPSSTEGDEMRVTTSGISLQVTGHR
jgi:hypothetical protein